MQLPVSQAVRLIHIGLVCRSMDETRPKLEALLGVRWAGGEPDPWDLVVFGERRQFDMRIAHGYAAPTHYELIEAVADTPWQLDGEVALHHLCFYSPSSVETCLQLEAQGYSRVLGTSGDKFGYFKDPSGLLIEIIDDGLLGYLDGFYAKSKVAQQAAAEEGHV